MTGILRALRQEQWRIVGFAVAGFAITLLQAVAYYRLAGHTAGERELFGYALLRQAEGATTPIPAYFAPNAVSGYLELRAFAPLGIMFAAWALVSATATSSARIVARSAAFGLAAVIAATAACIGAFAGVASGGETVGTLGLLEAGLFLVGLATACYAVCLVVAQISPAATLTAGALLLVLYFLYSLSGVIPHLAAVAWLSPFRYYNLSDIRGLAGLVGISLAGTGLASFLSQRSPRAVRVTGRPTFEPAHARALAWPVARDLYPQRVAVAAWCATFAALGIVLVAASQASMRDVLSLPRLLPGLPRYIFAFYAQLLDETWFAAALLLLLAMVFAFVAGWSAQDRDGRLEAVISAPYSRPAVLLERLGALAVVAVAVAALSGLAVAVTSRVADLSLDVGHLAGASLLLIVFGVVMGAAGSLLTSWIPRAAPGLFAGFALASYLDDQIGGALGLPSWLQTISAFRLVGAPVARGVDGRSLALMLLLALAGFGTSILLMQRRDVGA